MDSSEKKTNMIDVSNLQIRHITASHHYASYPTPARPKDISSLKGFYDTVGSKN